MTRLLRLVGTAGACFAIVAMATVGRGQYQDITGQTGTGPSLSSNNREQANISDQGTGYSSSQLSLYGPYYNQLLNSQNQFQSPYKMPGSASGLDTGRPASGLPLSGRRVNGRMFPLKKNYGATALGELGLTLGETDGKVRVLRLRRGEPDGSGRPQGR